MGGFFSTGIHEKKENEEKQIRGYIYSLPFLRSLLTTCPHCNICAEAQFVLKRTIPDWSNMEWEECEHSDDCGFVVYQYSSFQASYTRIEKLIRLERLDSACKIAFRRRETAELVSLIEQHTHLL